MGIILSLFCPKRNRVNSDATETISFDYKTELPETNLRKRVNSLVSIFPNSSDSDDTIT